MPESDIEIAVEAVGTEGAIRDIEESEEALEDAGDTMSDTADEMQGLNRSMSGAGAAIATALAATTAGILSSIPVVGEAFSGLMSVWDAVMFQVDDLMRALGFAGVGGVLFDLSSWIFELEGPAGWLVGILGSLAALAASAAAAFLAYTAYVGGLVAVKGALVAAGKVLVGILAAVAGAISLPVVAAIALIAAVGLLAWYFRDELWGALEFIWDKLTDFGNWLIEDLPGIFTRLLEFIGEWLVDVVVSFSEWVVDVVTLFADLMVDIGSFFADLTRDALGWGSDVIGNLIDGITGRARDLASAFSDVASRAADAFRDRFNDIIPDSVSIPSVSISIPSILGGGSVSMGGGSIDIPQLDTGGLIGSDGLAMLHAGERVVPSAQVDDRGRVEADSDSPEPFGAGGGGRSDIYLDGEKLNNALSRFRDDGLSRRGR